MTLFQGSANTFWQIVTWIDAGLMAIAIWYMVIIGRDRKPQRQRRGEESVERFEGVEENHAPIPKFLIYTFAGAAVWALGYLLWTGTKGVMGF